MFVIIRAGRWNKFQFNTKLFRIFSEITENIYLIFFFNILLLIYSNMKTLLCQIFCLYYLMFFSVQVFTCMQSSTFLWLCPNKKTCISLPCYPQLFTVEKVELTSFCGTRCCKCPVRCSHSKVSMCFALGSVLRWWVVAKSSLINIYQVMLTFIGRLPMAKVFFLILIR